MRILKPKSILSKQTRCWKKCSEKKKLATEQRFSPSQVIAAKSNPIKNNWKNPPIRLLRRTKTRMKGSMMTLLTHMAMTLMKRLKKTSQKIIIYWIQMAM